MTPDHYQELALKTWYSPDDSRYLDPRHPLIKLAGEAGELLDLYGKHEYKPGFDWWDCKKCGVSRERLEKLKNWKGGNIVQCCYDGPVPLVLDELGDWWYYLRIVTYQKGESVEQWVKELETIQYNNPNLTPLYCLSVMSKDSSDALYLFVEFGNVGGAIWNAFVYFMRLLSLLDCTLDRLTELNYAKLNSEPTAHGWKSSPRQP